MTAPIPSTDQLRDAARDAFLYALPLTEIANVRSALLGSGIPQGRFFALKGLATPADRFVTTPNVDTVYANTFIDLRGGSATITLPPLGNRYASLALMDMFGDHIAVLGSRTTGQDAGTFALVGPTDPAPAGAIRSTTPWVWALARVVVHGPGDVPAALDVLRGFQCLAAPATGSWASGASRSGSWEQWLGAANALMLENPAPATDGLALQRMAPLGIGRPDFDLRRFTPAEMERIGAGIGDAQALSRSMGFGGRRVGSWLYPAPNTGNFFQDYLGRARIAVSGLAALPPVEATYLAAIPSEGGVFDGTGPWRLAFGAGRLPPVDAFWSLTMYEVQTDGSLYLTTNSIDRYTIGDRTPGLAYAADGGLEICISRVEPAGVSMANWLPAPRSGPFVVILRAYLPRPEIVAQNYVPPALQAD
jgi:hypothetical protein